MIEAVLFDVDGTLLDSVAQHAAAWFDTLKHFGKRPLLEEVRRQIGKGDDQLLPVFFSGEELRRFGPDVSEYRAHLFKTTYLPHVKALPGVRALFERLRGDGYRIALASSANSDDMQVYKEIAHIDDLVEREADKSDARHSKPSPDIFAAALDRLSSVLPADAVAIGDTPWDAEAAGSLGIHPIGVLSGGRSQADLRRAGCQVVYRDVAEFLAHYEQSVFGQEAKRLQHGFGISKR